MAVTSSLDIISPKLELPRRQFQRHISSIPADFHAYGETFVGTIVNLSIAGAMITGCYSLAPHARIALHIPEIGDINAFIIWSNYESLGLKFANADHKPENIETALAQTLSRLPVQAEPDYESQYKRPSLIH